MKSNVTTKWSHKKQQAEFVGRMKVPVQVELITKIQSRPDFMWILLGDDSKIGGGGGTALV